MTIYLYYPLDPSRLNIGNTIKNCNYKIQQKPVIQPGGVGSSPIHVGLLTGPDLLRAIAKVAAVVRSEVTVLASPCSVSFQILSPYLLAFAFLKLQDS